MTKERKKEIVDHYRKQYGWMTVAEIREAYRLDMALAKALAKGEKK